MFKPLLLAAMFAASAVPAVAWETVSDMNKQIDETNFIVGDGCSGTLISIQYRLIVTAHHCIARQITTVSRDVVDADGKIEKVQFEKRDRVEVHQRDYSRFENVGSISYQTVIVAFKQERDLALLQLVGDNLRSTVAAPVLPKGGDIQRGESVFAVGNPRMLDASVTTGVISSTSRTFQTPWALNELVPMLQFDANIQPGSSGGALFTTAGVYIGTTVAAFPGSDLSLAIPAYELQDLLVASCMASVFDPAADDEKCRADKAGESEEDAEGEHDHKAHKRPSTDSKKEL